MGWHRLVATNLGNDLRAFSPPQGLTSAMSRSLDGDYVLGTGDEEIQRLGLQHRVWRSTVLECWNRAGLTIGSRVLDVGAGPGYATMDLAEIVGPTGEVVAVERSARFVKAAQMLCRARGLTNVRVHELDLMTDELPAQRMDAAWCRWVASFVQNPAMLVAKLAAAIRPGGVAIFHEYSDYSTWRLAPRNRWLEEFVLQVMDSWRASGGEPDIALALPSLLAQAGFRMRSAEPRIFCTRHVDYAWNWPASFIDTNLRRLVELERVDEAWAATVRRAFEAAQADPNSLMLTPMVLEIVAERLTSAG